MSAGHQDWRRTVRDVKSLLARALNVEERDPVCAEIFRYFAEQKALLLCEVVPGPLAVARRALVLRARRHHGHQKNIWNIKRRRGRGGRGNSENL